MKGACPECKEIHPVTWLPGYNPSSNAEEEYMMSERGNWIMKGHMSEKIGSFCNGMGLNPLELINE